MADVVALSGRVHEIRVECFGHDGISILGVLLGLPARTWVNYEAGITMPAEVILRFIDLTGVNPAYLLRGEGPRFSAGTALRRWR